MGEVNLLSLEGSEQFRKKLVARNLPPYEVNGVFRSNADPQNFVSELTDAQPIDTQNISSEIFKNASVLTRVNKFGGEIIDGAGLITVTPLEQGDNQDNPPKQEEYNPNETRLDIVNEFFIDNAEIVNRYIPNDGYQDLFFVTEKILPKETPKGAYPKFVFTNYNLSDILSGQFDNIQDSYLSQISAQYLNDSLQDRIDWEIRKQTIGRVNLDAFNSPFDVALLATGQEPLVVKNYRITVPDGLFDQAKDLIQRFTGSQLPTSPIEGDYFNEPDNKKQSARQLLENALPKIFKPANPNNNPSKKFLNNTGSGQKSVLFRSLNYNTFKPDYDTNKTQLGVFIDNLFNRDNSLINLYLGKTEVDANQVIAPSDSQSPTNAYENQTSSIVYGPTEISKLYEGDSINDLNFGQNGLSYSDSGSLDGGLTWISPKTIGNIGKLVGKGGETGFGSDPNPSPKITRSTDSYFTNFENKYKKGSILDETQRLIDAADNVEQGQRKRQHAGYAINQISKVFFDGYKEITKGSKVINYVNNSNGAIQGKEYCRVFTKDTPYWTLNDLQQKSADVNGSEVNGNIRKSSYSILDSTFNLNIAPLNGQGSTNIKDGRVKKYMFSIENLAWRDTDEFNDLPACEKGPNGGRVMWFPPYDLTFSDTSSPTFKETVFIGRPEPIYTYERTKRTGNLSWKIIVDHPSVLNLIVDKVLANESDDQLVNGIVSSFFAGCKKYDIYEIAQRFNTIPFSDLQKLYEQVIGSPTTSIEQKTEAANNLPTSTDNQPTDNQTFDFQQFYDKGFYFDSPNNASYGQPFEDLYDTYVGATSRQLYENGNPSESVQTSGFFDQVIIPNKGEMDSCQVQVFDILKNKKAKSVKIKLIGTTFPGVNDGQNLATQMTQSVIEYFQNTTFEDGTSGNQFIETGVLSITLDTQLSSSNTPPGSQSYDCSGTIEPQNETFSTRAMACRSVRIKEIIVEPLSPTDESGGNVPSPLNNESGQKPQTSQDPLTKKQGISKYLIRKLLNEQNYFNLLVGSDPLVLDTIKRKIKHFSPAFHSITPEGLNGRLVFLNQCTRPGNTIPVKNENGELVRNDSINTSFGKPPVLILRIGDFFNTKIIPGTIQFSYESLDLNPAGIGVQPMIATIQMSFDIIGGMGIKEPVERLQNAMSFNYYANTEIYDDRAVETEDFSAVDNDLLQKIISQPNFNASTQNENIGGNAIGNIVTENGNSGTIEYKTFFNKFIDQTKSYFSTITNNAITIVNEYNLGVYKQITTQRNFTTGFLNNLNYPQQKEVTIFGKPSEWESKLNVVLSDLTDDINQNLDPISIYLSASTSSNLDKTTIKQNLTNLLDETVNNGFDSLSSKIQETSNIELNYIQNFSKLDFISYSGDGKLIGVPNLPIVFKLTGITEDGSNSLTQISSDYDTIIQNLIDFYNLSLSNGTIIIGEDNSLFETITSELTTDSEKRFYTLLSTYFTDSSKKQTFIDTITANLTSNTAEMTKTSISNFYDVFSQKCITEKNAEIEKLINFEKSNEYKIYKEYNPQSNGKSLNTKERVMNYNKTTLDVSYNEILTSIYSQVNTNDDNNTFNGKVQFNS